MKMERRGEGGRKKKRESNVYLGHAYATDAGLQRTPGKECGSFRGLF